MLKNFISRLGAISRWLINGTKLYGIYIVALIASEYTTYFYVKTALSAFGSVEISSAVAIACVGAFVVSITVAASGKDPNPEGLLLALITGIITWIGINAETGIDPNLNAGGVLFSFVVAFALFVARIMLLLYAKPKSE
jgi:hypothetical protein